MNALRSRPVTGAVALVAVVAGMFGFLRGEPAQRPGAVGAAQRPGAADTAQRPGAADTARPGSSFATAVAQIMAFVERERGLVFLRSPSIVVAGPDGLARRLRAIAAAKRDTLVKENDLHLTLGILPPDTNLAEELAAFESASVQALYDDDAREVVLKDTALTPYARVTLAHELTHALDDQHFPLNRPDLVRARDGSDFGLMALGEGNARRIEYAYLATLTDAERQADRAERARLTAGSAGSGADPYLGLYAGAPYEYGVPLVTAILERGGVRALDDAFRSPPATHEQVLFPARYLARERARPVAAPRAGGPVTDRGVIGAFKLGVLLGDGPGQGAAARWGGDRYAVWHDRGGQRACLRARVVGDAPEDTAALAAALRRWAHGQPDASARTVGGQVEITACNVRGGRPAWSGPPAGGTVDRCPGSPLAGFGEAQVTVTGPGGGTVTRCLHLADSPRRVNRGLMRVTDSTLGGYGGMLFLFPTDTTDAFWMRDTPMPLSIAYLDGLGRVVSTVDMHPCADRADCPLYPPAGPYRYAVEAPRGHLADLGLVAGATLRVDGLRPGAGQPGED